MFGSTHSFDSARAFGLRARAAKCIGESHRHSLDSWPTVAVFWLPIWLRVSYVTLIASTCNVIIPKSPILLVRLQQYMLRVRASAGCWTRHREQRFNMSYSLNS